MTVDALAGFSPATRAWFRDAFAAPTAAQSGAWQAIQAGQHVLVIAPTGSGKTLAAFLAALDQLAAEPPPADAQQRCRVLYVSPLKALAVDVERNLRAPLAGIRHTADRLGLPQPHIEVAVRSGDTPAADRRRFGAHPSDILITTPESLFLILTSQAREALRGVRTVIVDEVHALAGAKRGAHLALSLERLDALLDSPAQRIGLSATVRPIDEVARFLGGTQQVTVVAPRTDKTVDVQVVVPVEDMTELGQHVLGEHTGSAAGPAVRTSVWPHVEERIVDLIAAHRSTIVFANSRRLAERLCARINEIAWARIPASSSEDSLPADGAAVPLPLKVIGQPDATAGCVGCPRSWTGVGAAAGASAEIARTHHGSVSKEERAAIEDALKSGQLPAVVATSSLELGIDMGAVDLVVQVESPPSVASGLQRIGRAGHQVGAVSRGVIFPKHRGDLVQTAVVAERMRAGVIEALRYPRNPLDVLAQQIVAMTAMDSWHTDELLALVRRAASFATLPTSGYEAVLDMLAGRYPSDVFAELRPRLVWDRATGALTGRPGGQRLAVTSGGTIPDRGLFGVFLAGEQTGSGRSRVGELDEEMVYESRVGDIFVLGATSWRIEDITSDRVLVSPAPGQPGKLPFWKGDALGRPLELGRAVGAFLRELGQLDAIAAQDRVIHCGLDAWAAGNLLAYLAEQRAATGYLPDDRTIVVERFRDELGDWRVVVHSPWGAPVHAPWALAMAARLREQYGVDVQAMPADDGIVLRLPDMGVHLNAAPSADLAVFLPEEMESLVTGEVGGSALFAARFRESAARALLLPRRRPGRRAPLWQQRQRAAQLLAVASQHDSFPIVLETMRECLHDVFDVPGLVKLMRDLAARRVRLVEVTTAQPSPFARSLLFEYVGAFLYEGDAPLAERRAAALALDATLLAELLGQPELRELLDAAVVAAVEAELQWLTEARRVRDAEDTADLLRVLGSLSTAEATERGVAEEWLTELEQARRVIRIRIAGQQRWAAVEDAGRLRDALGVPLPVGVPDAFTEPVGDPLRDVLARYARTHGPFPAGQAAERFGLGVGVVTETLQRLAATGQLVRGEFRPSGLDAQWCDAEVLRRLRRRSLAALRHEVEPAPAAALARFLPTWQHVSGDLRGVDGVLRAVEQLQGAAVPASALEQLVLPARVADYAPAMLDELCATGEVLWAGHGSLPGNDGWVSLYLADAAPLLLPPVEEKTSLSPLHQQLLKALRGGGALFFRQLSDRVGSLGDAELVPVLWDLAWAGLVTNDTLAPVRALTRAGCTSHSSGRRVSRPRPRSRYPRGQPALPTRTGPPTVAGRWSLLPEREPDPTRRTYALTESLLDRHGVVTRGSAVAEQVPGGFAAVYRVLTGLEEAGHCRRGYFVEGLGASQFALPGAVDRMRAQHTVTERTPRARSDQATALVLAATDPANPYGAALPWPDRPGEVANGHKPGRKAGALVVLVNGDLVLYIERGGRSLLTWTDDPALLQPALAALASAVREGSLGKLTVERADGHGVLTSPLGQALQQAGFHPTPRGLRLRGGVR